MRMEKIKIINHTADTGIEVYGKNIEELFLNSAMGLYKIMGVEYDEGENFLEIKLEATSLEELLIKFLNELIYLTEIKKIGGNFEKIDIEKNKDRHVLNATLKIRKIKSTEKEIKAATYHNLKIENVKDGFKTTIIFDL